MRARLVGILAAYSAFALGPPAIVEVSVPVDEPQSLYITFDSAPELRQIKTKSRWSVYITGPDGTKRAHIDGVDTSTLSTEKTIRVIVNPPIPADATAIDISYVGPDSVVHVPATDIVLFKNASGGGKLTGSTADDTDIYIKGSYAAVKNGDPVYDIDSYAGYMRSLQVGKNKTYLGRFGAYGQVRTKQSAKADPDSFLTYLVYQRHIGTGTNWLGPFSLPYLNYRFAGWEFDRTGKQLNFVTSPVLTVPLRLSGKLPGELQPGVSIPYMTFQLGTEFVNVRSSPVAQIGQWHTRGLLGATFSSGYAPQKPWLYSIQLTSGYQVRIPSKAEIFYEDKFAPSDPTTGQKGDPPPMLGTQARHTIDTKFTYSFAEWVGITFEHTYGSLPPLFNKTAHTFEIGLSLTLKQTSYGRYSILKP